jgi:hypothetical protein
VAFFEFSLNLLARAGLSWERREPATGVIDDRSFAARAAATVAQLGRASPTWTDIAGRTICVSLEARERAQGNRPRAAGSLVEGSA